MAAIQLAKCAGTTVIATASREEKLKRLEALGLDYPINLRPRVSSSAPIG